MNEYKRILVVSRMIQSCRKAIQVGVSLAHKFDAELFVIHSIYNPFGLKGWSFGTLSIEKEYQKLLVDTRRQLSELVESEKQKGMAIKELVREGEPTGEILKTIEEEKIDLLVMLAHEEGRLEDLFFNRSNDELVRKMPCSLMLVKKEAGTIVEGEVEDQ
jgi:nucleotide-binding universal stress UspA family protein